MALINWVIGIIKFAISLCLVLAMLFSFFFVLYSGYDLLKNGWSAGTAGMAVAFMFAIYLLDKMSTFVNSKKPSKRGNSSVSKLAGGEYYYGGGDVGNYTAPSYEYSTVSKFPTYDNQPDFAGAMQKIHDMTYNQDPLVANRPENASTNQFSDLNRSLHSGY